MCARRVATHKNHTGAARTEGHCRLKANPGSAATRQHHHPHVAMQAEQDAVYATGADAEVRANDKNAATRADDTFAARGSGSQHAKRERDDGDGAPGVENARAKRLAVDVAMDMDEGIVGKRVADFDRATERGLSDEGKEDSVCDKLPIVSSPAAQIGSPSRGSGGAGAVAPSLLSAGQAYPSTLEQADVYGTKANEELELVPSLARGDADERRENGITQSVEAPMPNGRHHENGRTDAESIALHLNSNGPIEDGHGESTSPKTSNTNQNGLAPAGADIDANNEDNKSSTSSSGLDFVRCACGWYEDVGQMVECSKCRCWSHAVCIGWETAKHFMASEKEAFECFVCIRDSESIQPDSLSYAVRKAIERERRRSECSNLRGQLF
ncbi:Histone-lysine N-methyltransferase ASH1L [Porphyridium purpureum]|uniref:Histone-lysine N-methyltransferase ASH1L n=1 Tax=Porphyridium purpureum TaxID=35688 RepID=A0A5J4YTF6_PORPP|nr:Histone-lysine N-methyltransferase ASH1L [Porphyridium purpureum]|eukprot:POR8892..scf229_5